MKRIGSLPLVLTMILILAGCAGGGSVATTRSAELAPSPGLVLTDEGSIGAATGFAVIPRFDFGSGKLTAQVRATEAKELKAALLSVTFPATDFHLVRGEYTGGLGADGEVLTLIKACGSRVFLGAVLPRYQERAGVSGDLDLFRLEFDSGPDVSGGSPLKAALGAPPSPQNSVDLSGNIDEENMVHLLWTELNKGDGNNDGTLTIMDITPIAAYFQQEANPDVPATLLADYNSDGAVSILDITMLAAGFMNDLDGYNVESMEQGAGTWTRIPPQGSGQATLLRPEKFPSPSSADGPLHWTFDYGPIEGTFSFRVVAHSTMGVDGAVSKNTVTLTGIVEFEEVRVSYPAEREFLVITEETQDDIVGNEQPFACKTLQLTGEGRQIDHEEFIEATERLQWRILTGGQSATVGNTPGVDKGLVTATDVGTVTVLASDPENPLVMDSVEVPIYAIWSLETKVEGQPTPADVTVAQGDTVQFVVTGTFDDNDSDVDDMKQFDLTSSAGAGWILERPLVDKGPPPVWQAGDFILDADAGAVYTLASDPDLESGFSVSVCVVFPPEGIVATIGGGYRAQSNYITITLE